MTRKTLIHALYVVVVFACATASKATKLNVDDAVPEISVIDNKGAEFNYPSDANGILLAAFISPAKTQSIKALSDLEQIINAIDKSPKDLSVLIVLEDDPNSVHRAKIKETISNARLRKHVVVDQGYKLWGAFGVIASPTVFMAGVDHKIIFIKPGYGYDFAPAVKSKLQMALGLTSEDTFSKTGGVKTAKNDAVSGKVSRHLQMAKMLQKQQKYETALKQLELAVQIDPNSTEALLELGRLYCTLSEPQKAVDTVNPIDPPREEQQAVRSFILGKGHLLLKEYIIAEKYLLESTQLDSRSSEAYYLLGRVYHLQNQTEKAVEAYYQSLRLLHGQSG